MKKIVLIMVAALIGTSVYADVSMPGAPSFGTTVDTQDLAPSSAYKKPGFEKPESKPVSSFYDVDKPLQSPISSVESMAKAMAVAELKGDRTKSNEIYKKMLEKGVSNVQVDTHINSCPYRKGIPPVTIGGKTYTGKKCVFVKYKYNGNSTGTGACQ